MTSTLSSATPPTRLLDWNLSHYFEPIPWVATPTTFYWSDGSAIYARPLSVLRQ